MRQRVISQPTRLRSGLWVRPQCCRRPVLAAWALHASPLFEVAMRALLGGGGYFQFAGGVVGRQPSRFHQRDVDLVGLPRLQDDLLDKLVVPGLADDYFVLAGQEH